MQRLLVLVGVVVLLSGLVGCGPSSTAHTPDTLLLTDYAFDPHYSPVYGIQPHGVFGVGENPDPRFIEKQWRVTDTSIVQFLYRRLLSPNTPPPVMGSRPVPSTGWVLLTFSQQTTIVLQASQNGSLLGYFILGPNRYYPNDYAIEKDLALISKTPPSFVGPTPTPGVSGG